MKLRGFLSVRSINRAWYYFRIGYGTYLTFLLGYLSTLVTVYYLAVKNAPMLLDLFPKFGPFAILATVVGGPLAIAIGWIHLKRSELYSSEALVAIESNPFSYRLAPGYVRDAYGPAMLAQVKLLRRLSERAGVLTASEKAELEELEKKWMTLVEGGHVGSPRRNVDST